MSEYDLKFNKAKIVEITPSYLGVLMDGSVHYNIGLTNSDTELDIKKTILSHASTENNFGLNIAPFSRVEEIPKTIRDSVNSEIDLKKLREEVLSEEENANRLKIINCNDAREEILPSYNELILSLYEKDIKKNSTKYDEVLERIEIAFSLFPLEMGETISVEKYEEIINGL